MYGTIKRLTERGSNGNLKRPVQPRISVTNCALEYHMSACYKRQTATSNTIEEWCALVDKNGDRSQEWGAAERVESISSYFLTSATDMWLLQAWIAAVDDKFNNRNHIHQIWHGESPPPVRTKTRQSLRQCVSIVAETNEDSRMCNATIGSRNLSHRCGKLVTPLPRNCHSHTRYSNFERLELEVQIAARHGTGTGAGNRCSWPYHLQSQREVRLRVTCFLCF